MFVLSASEISDAERLTVERGETSSYRLMKRAGEGAARVILDLFGSGSLESIIIIAGKGNNGGDGFLIAQALEENGIRTCVFLVADKTTVSGDAKRAMEGFIGSRGDVRKVVTKNHVSEVADKISGSDLIVDAMFGTGLRSGISGLHLALVRAINASKVPVVSVDIPSGIDADTGRPIGEAVRATVTVTFGYPKIGQVVFPGADYSGRLICVDIGITANAVALVNPKTQVLLGHEMREYVPARVSDSHKGEHGHLVVVAGSKGKSGAAVLSASAALRCGTGLVTLAGPVGLSTIFACSIAEIMTDGLPETQRGGMKHSARALKRVVSGKSAICLGPGVGVSTETRRITRWLVRNSTVPLLIDADGLNCLASDLKILRVAQAPVILTPHPGEMATLMGSTTEDVQANRIRVARDFAFEHTAYLVLKGARTVIAFPDGRVFINPTGNPGMATAGMGDALAGVIAGLVAQGVDPGKACCLGAFWHGFSGDRMAQAGTRIGMLASDLIGSLPGALSEMMGVLPARTRARGYFDIVS